MLYRLVLNYFRFKIMRLVLARLMMRAGAKGSLKSANILSFLEVLLSQYATKKTRR